MSPQTSSRGGLLRAHTCAAGLQQTVLLHLLLCRPEPMHFQEAWSSHALEVATHAQIVYGLTWSGIICMMRCDITYFDRCGGVTCMMRYGCNAWEKYGNTFIMRMVYVGYSHAECNSNGMPVTTLNVTCLNQAHKQVYACKAGDIC